FLHLALEGEELLHRWPLLHALEMRRAILELRLVEREERAAAEAPVEMCIGGGEMVEEPFAPGEHLIDDSEFLEEQLLRQALHHRLRIRQVADELRGVDAKEIGMDARGAEREDRDCL